MLLRRTEELAAAREVVQRRRFLQGYISIHGLMEEWEGSKRAREMLEDRWLARNPQVAPYGREVMQLAGMGPDLPQVFDPESVQVMVRHDIYNEQYTACVATTRIALMSMDLELLVGHLAQELAHQFEYERHDRLSGVGGA